MRIITSSLFLFLFSVSAYANPSDSWNTCPSNYSQFENQIQKFDQEVQKQFSKTKEKEIRQIYLLDEKDAENILLRHFAPYLLPSDLISGADKSCWAHYEGFLKQIKSHNSQKSTELNDWESCILAKYNKLPPLASKIMTCYKKVAPPQK